MNTEQNYGRWLQRFWWGIRDLYRQLKRCRFGFVVAFVAVLVFLCVAQGTEILHTVGEGHGWRTVVLAVSFRIFRGIDPVDVMQLVCGARPSLSRFSWRRRRSIALQVRTKTCTATGANLRASCKSLMNSYGIMVQSLLSSKPDEVPRELLCT
jgi:hypothetical protein